ncbi:MAG TPA: SUF system Fe-S cluster assembly protein [Gemmatales bacterium]|nr:SUF system Fe-S cluster assembly protein [Gemmatales bacterium]
MNSITPLGMGKLGLNVSSDTSISNDPSLPLKDRIIRAIQSIYDPEIPVNIYELGLIYNIDISENNEVNIKMTLTSPACPVAGSLPEQVKKKILSLSSIKSVDVQLVWEPPWTRDRMSEAARLELGIF